MLVSIHQPNFLPWLGFFDKVAQSNIFILLDNAQFEKNEWQNRNRIKGPGGPQWLTVPVVHRFPQTIAETRIDDTSNWRRKHWNAIVSNYRKAPWFSQYAGRFEAVYERSWDRLVDLNVHLFHLVCNTLGFERRVHLASEFPVASSASCRLAELCAAVDGDAYLAGAGAYGYLDTKPFEDRNIRVEFQNYRHPVYPQLFGAFVSHLSVLDLLFNCGDRSLAVIRGQSHPEDRL